MKIVRTGLILTLLVLTAAFSQAADKPNIILILADDLGYGDVKALNPDSKIPTPALDKLAADGLIFTDMHSPSSVCTPTRYGILTGRYNWRSSLKKGVLGGYSPALIEPERTTMASVLKGAGYHTAVIGKWHLGLNWAKLPSYDSAKSAYNPQDYGSGESEIDFSRPFTGGPLTLGFDDYFGISASLDMPPFTFLENDRVAEIPVTRKTWVREGTAAESFEAVDVLPKITEKAVRYIESRSGQAKQGKPFFLYFPLNAPHAPILPSPQWKGKSGINDYADFVMQTDDTVRQIVTAVDKCGLAENTIIVFTSDNGCSPVAGIPQLREHGHDPSAGFRGAKADIFEGGHRVPFIVRWPNHIKPQSSTGQLACLIDLIRTFAEITGQQLSDNAAEDGVSLLSVWNETAVQPVRTEVIHHSINGSFAIRQGDWKLSLCPDSGGWSVPKPGSAQAKRLPEVQLYNLRSDTAETTNKQAEQSEVVQELKLRLDKIIGK
ncbi:MAG: arylsulfatase [Planctomycetaceae bacterium]|jgi:arylsulfatase A-like enzyme|nr:arylsulfatase [Planctomycetaceae bacterium]